MSNCLTRQLEWEICDLIQHVDRRNIIKISFFYLDPCVPKVFKLKQISIMPLSHLNIEGPYYIFVTWSTPKPRKKSSFQRLLGIYNSFCSAFYKFHEAIIKYLNTSYCYQAYDNNEVIYFCSVTSSVDVDLWHDFYDHFYFGWEVRL